VWDGSIGRGFDAGNNLKSNSGWYLGFNGADLYDFTVLPVGYRHFSDSLFYYQSKSAAFWTSTEVLGSWALYRIFVFNFDFIDRFNYNRNFGMSVRCLKDH